MAAWSRTQQASQPSTRLLLVVGLGCLLAGAGFALAEILVGVAR